MDEITVSSSEELKIVHSVFKTKYQFLISDLLKICLDRGEERICCILVASYEFYFDYSILFKCIKERYFEIMKYIFSFGKNYYGDRHSDNAESLSYYDLILYLKEEFVDSPVDFKKYLKKVIKWRIISDDSML